MTARRGLILLFAALALGASGCGPDQTLEQAIQCGQFARLPDGSWSTTQEVSLNYRRDGVTYQNNFAKGLAISAKIGPEGALIAAALDKKCAAKQ